MLVRPGTYANANVPLRCGSKPGTETAAEKRPDGRRRVGAGGSRIGGGPRLEHRVGGRGRPGRHAIARYPEGSADPGSLRADAVSGDRAHSGRRRGCGKVAPATSARPFKREARRLCARPGEKTMNTPELDERLEQWRVPPLPRSLCESGPAGVAARRLPPATPPPLVVPRAP